MNGFNGLLLEESFKEDKLEEALKLITIKNKEVWDVSNAVDWQPKKWTAVTFVGESDRVDIVTVKLSKLIKPKWYLNISDEKYSYVVFHEKVFKYLKGDNERLKEAQQYALDIGVPRSQIGWEKGGLQNQKNINN